jgi:hypothetical protein
MAAGFKRRVWLWILGIGLAVLVVGGLVLPAALLPNVRENTKRFYCRKCGIGKVVKQITSTSDDMLETQSEHVSTDLSAWYESHYPSPCEHVWQLNHTALVGYFVVGPLRMRAGAAGYGSYPTPRLLWLDENQRQELDKRYQEDKAACHQYISVALKPREEPPTPPAR